MNKKAIYISGAVILAVVGISAFLMSKKPQDLKQNNPQMVQESNSNPLKTSTNTTEQTTGGNYVEYSKSILENSADKRRILFFYADWCPTCRPTDKDLKENISIIPQDVMVIRVNYNDTYTDQEEKELANKYDITYQHTFVQIDNQGNEVTKWNGVKTEELLANIK